MIERFTVSTRVRTELLDITPHVRSIVQASGVRDGVCQVYIPHTTAGVTINENADPDVRTDMVNILEKLVPWRDNYHHMEGNSAAHLKASLMGFSQTVPVHEGGLVLGTWQCIYFCEFDGPRTRTVHVNVMKSA